MPPLQPLPPAVPPLQPLPAAQQPMQPMMQPLPQAPGGYAPAPAQPAYGAPTGYGQPAECGTQPGYPAQPVYAAAQPVMVPTVQRVKVGTRLKPEAWIAIICLFLFFWPLSWIPCCIPGCKEDVYQETFVMQPVRRRCVARVLPLARSAGARARGRETSACAAARRAHAGARQCGDVWGQRAPTRCPPSISGGRAPSQQLRRRWRPVAALACAPALTCVPCAVHCRRCRSRSPWSSRCEWGGT